MGQSLKKRDFRTSVATNKPQGKLTAELLVIATSPTDPVIHCTACTRQQDEINLQTTLQKGLLSWLGLLKP